jgi:Fur family ferric uptake transcriptional regulator
MSINMSDLKEKFHEKQYKLTPQRQVILQTFVDHEEKHLSAEDVYHIVRQRAPEIGLATVYRTLELLSELDVLQKMDFGDGRSRYEINESNTLHHHHHLICLDCGTVKEFEDDLMETLETVIARKSKFQIVDHQVKFYGYCEDCQKKREHEE